MKAPNLNGQTAPFSQADVRAYVALWPASEEEGAPAEGTPQPITRVVEWGQFCGYRASEIEKTNRMRYDGLWYDPLLEGWTNEWRMLDLDNILLSATDHSGDAPKTIYNPQVTEGAWYPIGEDGEPVKTGRPYYGWVVLHHGQAVFDTGEDTTEDFGTVVGGLRVGCWCTTSDPDDRGFEQLRQQSPAKVFAIQSDPAHPLPVNPSFELGFRLDDLQTEGSGAVADPSAAYVSCEFGGSQWRVRLCPIPKDPMKAATSHTTEQKTSWCASLDRKTKWGWMEVLGPNVRNEGKNSERRLSRLQPDGNGMIHLVVQCIDGRIVLRSGLGADLAKVGEVYSIADKRTGVEEPLTVKASPLIVKGAYCTFRFTFRRVMYREFGWALFPPIYRQYESQVGVEPIMAEKIRATITGTGLVRKELTANAPPWNFRCFTWGEKWSSWNQWTFPYMRGGWAQFSPTDTFRVVIARKIGSGGSELGVEFVPGFSEIDPMALTAQYGPMNGTQTAFDPNDLGGVPANANLLMLRLQAANVLPPVPYFGESTLPGGKAAFSGVNSVVVRTLKVEWPIITEDVTPNWVEVPRDQWLAWMVDSQVSGDTVTACHGTIVRDDTALPEATGPMAAWHGRAWWKLTGGWKNGAGTLWTSGDRYLMLSKGPRRGKDEAELPLFDIVQLVRDIGAFDIPPQDFELYSDVVTLLCNRAGVPSGSQVVTSSGRRIDPQIPDRPAQFMWTEKQDGLDVLQKIAEADCYCLRSEGDKLAYYDPLGAPTAAQNARRFAYSDGRDASTLASQFPIQDGSGREPTEDDREVTEVVVIADTEDGPLHATASVGGNRATDMTVVGGVGRVKRLVLGGSTIKTLRTRNRILDHTVRMLAADVGDFAVQLSAADPELRLGDVGTLDLTRHDLADGTVMECVAISERADRDGSYKMTGQFRVARDGSVT